IILDLQSDPTDRELQLPARATAATYCQALAQWFQQAVLWVRSGEGAAEVLGGLPEPPILPGRDERATTLAAWLALLPQDIRSILDQVPLDARSAIAPQAGDAAHALG